MPYKPPVLPKGTTLAEVNQQYIIQPLYKQMLSLDTQIQQTRDPKIKAPLEVQYQELQAKLDKALGKDIITPLSVDPPKTKKQLEAEAKALVEQQALENKDEDKEEGNG